MGDYTPSIDDNLLNISDRNKLNEEEARGIIRAEEFMYDLDESIELTSSLILQLNKTAFGHLYEWAGKWRTSDFKVGSHIPPPYQEVPSLIYQFLEELNFKLRKSSDNETLIKSIAFAHHQVVKIHPFNNGNGRTARLLSDLIALINGYDHIILYHRQGEERQTYLEAIRAADKYDYKKLEELIKQQLKPMK
ncbi:MAG: hypothetical protein GY816_19135 [Cytophagales bacterium]|nr:hypothetical protein [Cytophagales bacterium]